MGKMRILMFCASFFGYEKRILGALHDQDFDVDLYDELPNRNFVGKACVRYNVGLYRPVIRRYIEGIIDQNREKQYDYVFVIKGEAITGEAVALLREAYPSAKFVLYLWDSVANIPECERRIALYDRVLSFDPHDAQTYGMVFRPLFFAKEYEAQAMERGDYRYAFAFIGTAHTVRPLIAKKLAHACRTQGKETFAYLFLPHPMIYLYNKVCNPAYHTVKKSDIHFEALNAQQIKEVYQRSCCILDVEHQKQRGLTMRTIELVGMQKKIITTNSMVKEYDFYNPANICVIDRQNPVVEEFFWDREYEPVPQQILYRYSLEAFIREIFDLKEKEDGE